MKITNEPIDTFIPHRGKMQLIDQLIFADKDKAIATTHLTEKSLFASKQGIPAYIGIEYMAQTIAAYSGAQDKMHGSPISVGLLLGTRSYKSHLSFFPIGATLQIEVHSLFFSENDLAAFKCSIKINDALQAESTLSVLNIPTMEVN